MAFYGGNLYFCDTSNDCIRMVNPAGIISTVAGLPGVYGYTGDGGLATAAQINGPYGIYFDGSGNFYFSDEGNEVIRKVDTSGIITTVAGNGTGGFSGDGGSALSAQFNAPRGIVIDASGNLYAADLGNSRVRKITAGGTISTFAGTGVLGYTGDGGPAASAELYDPEGLALDSAGNLYIADWGDHVVRKVNTGGVISTVAGDNALGYSGDGGLATSAQLDEPLGVAVDGSGNLYIADTGNSVIRMVNTAGIISTVAGNHTPGYSGDGGPATAASFDFPNAVAVDGSGVLYIADTQNDRIRKLCP
jgi:sugar lactone lactonase YvrE